MISAKGKPARSFPCWIDAFCDYTEKLPVSPLFRRWAGISAIAGALERKVWLSPFGDPLYPNFYIILVAPAGVGKTVISNVVSRMWRELPDHHVAPTNVSRATLIDALNDAKRRIVRLGEEPPYIEFNSMSVAANELGVFIPQWDMDFINHLTDLWDGFTYQERKRTGSISLKIDRPFLNMLGSTTPSWLITTMPPGAWEQGFCSRTLFIYSGERIIKDLEGLALDFNRNGDDGIFTTLVKDLKAIGELYGAVTFEQAAADAVRAWHLAGGPPSPEHPKLESYLTRRTVHLLKLCMIICVSKTDKLLITLDHYQEALGLLLQFEFALPDVFRAIIAGSDSAAMNELHYQMIQTYAKTQEPIAESFLVNFLRDRVPSNAVLRVIELAVKSGTIKHAPAGAFSAYIPCGKGLID